MLTSLRLYIGLLGEYLRPHRFRVALLALVIVTATGLQLAAPQFIRQFFDLAQERGELSPLYAAAALYLGIGLFGRAMSAVSHYLSADIGWRTTNRLRSDLTRHVLKLDMSFHNDHPPGELIERIDGDVERLANFFSQMSIVVIGGSLMVVGVLAIAWLEDWRYGLVMLGGALLDMTLRPLLCFASASPGGVRRTRPGPGCTASSRKEYPASRTSSLTVGLATQCAGFARLCARGSGRSFRPTGCPISSRGPATRRA